MLYHVRVCVCVHITVYINYIYIYYNIHAASPPLLRAAFALEPAAEFTAKYSISSVRKAALRSEAAADGCVMRWSWLHHLLHHSCQAQKVATHTHELHRHEHVSYDWQVHAVEQVQDAQIVGVVEATKARARDGLWQ